MQAISVCIVEIGSMLVHQGEESAQGIPVNNGDCPDIACLLHSLNIDIQILATLVGIRLVALPVLLVSMEVGTMDRREEHYLLRGESTLQGVHSDIDTSAIGIGIH